MLGGLVDSDETKPKHVVWQGCYDVGWGDLIVPDAFAHPAKFSCGLTRRIFKHGFTRGWWAKGDLIGDPFAGIGCGGLIAAGAGLRWFGVELEPRFVGLARDNFWARRHQCDTDPVIVQGDSRQFSSIVAASATGCDAIVTSPPYAGTSPEACSSGVDLRKNYETYRKAGGGSSWEKFVASRRKHEDGYGHTPGQIGSLPAGELDAVVTSPPYADSVKGAHGEQETAAESRDKRQTEGGSLGQSQRHGGYGASGGNIGNLKEGKLDAVVTSPPYESNRLDGGKTQTGSYEYRAPGKGTYGRANGQLGNESGETYWQAVAQVYEQCRLALKPGGMLVVVVKDYVKGGQRVPLCDQTLELLQRIGYEPVERIRAMLVKETREAGLFGEHCRVKSRKSFFRRLAEKKGSPPIDWEEVLCVRRGAE